VYRYEKEKKEMNNITKWQHLRKYINQRNIGDTIIRRDILKQIYKTNSGFKSASMTTVDTYRRMLELIGVLQTKKPGVYKIKYHIREDLTCHELNKLAYGDEYRRWFNDAKVTE
jgi:hypothetical protein